MKVCLTEHWENDGCAYHVQIHNLPKSDFIFDIPEATVEKWRKIIANKVRAEKYWWNVQNELSSLYRNREENNSKRPVSVPCPNCNKRFNTTDGELPDEYEGFGVSCPWCNQVVYKTEKGYAIRTTDYGWAMINRNLNKESSLDKKIRLAGIGSDKPKED